MIVEGNSVFSLGMQVTSMTNMPMVTMLDMSVNMMILGVKSLSFRENSALTFSFSYNIPIPDTPPSSDSPFI